MKKIPTLFFILIATAASFFTNLQFVFSQNQVLRHETFDAGTVISKFNATACLTGIGTGKICVNTTQNWVTYNIEDWDGCTEEPLFHLDADGAANDGFFWGNRQRIQSLSLGNAAILSPNELDNDGCVPLNNVMVSPLYDFNPNPQKGFADSMYLSFEQYFRNFSGSVSVEVCPVDNPIWQFSNCSVLDTTNTNWKQVFSNKKIGTNVETLNAEHVIVHLNPHLPTVNTPFWVRVRSSGDFYFMILDDVRVLRGNPYPPTVPPGHGPDVRGKKKKYMVDSRGGAYCPGQLVVEFKPGVTEARKKEVRDENKVKTYESCTCNEQLEKWIFPDEIICDTKDKSAQGCQIIDIDDVRTRLKKTSEIKDDDFNYILLPTYDSDSTKKADLSLASLPPNVPPTATDELVIAILDTGIDYNDPELQKYLRQTNIACYPQDLIGHNFINNNNNPLDDNAPQHGTRIAKIIIRTLDSIGISCPFKILPLKTHDADGLGYLYNTACGLYYAQLAGADVANMSWGWQGESDSILFNAIQVFNEKNQALGIAAAGNDTANLNLYNYFPGRYKLPGVIVVGSIKSGLPPVHSVFSNYSSTLVDIAAVGEGNQFPGIKDTLAGTSYAAPAVVAAAAYLKCLNYGDVSDAKDRILSCANKFVSLEPFVEEGRTLDIQNIPCLSTANCNEVSFKKVGNRFEIGNLYAPRVEIQVFSRDNNWAIVFDCFGNDCPQPITKTPNLPPGQYQILVKYYTENYQYICEQRKDLTIANTPSGDECRLATVVDNIVCQNNNTPYLPTDDTFTFDLLVSGENTGAKGWTAQIGATTVSGKYNNIFHAPPSPINHNATLPVHISDVDRPDCLYSIYLNSPAGCSFGTGTPADCKKIAITAGADFIKIENLSAPVVMIQIFDANWQTIFACYNSCKLPEQIITGLPTGQYFVKINYLNASWQPLCEREEFVGVAGKTNLRTGDERAVATRLPIKIEFDGGAVAYPNPLRAGQKLNIRLATEIFSEKIICTLADVVGNEVFRSVELADGAGAVQLDLPQHLSSGWYQLSIVSGRLRPVQRMIFLDFNP